jgi:Arc/MetJ-type ribon-helix-helix transcriptional regulator
MGVITVPVTGAQEAFITGLVKSGRAANKAHAMRMAIQFLAEEEAVQSIVRAEADVRAGRVFKGDLDKLAKKFVDV